jgi:hypothetical protein
MAPGRLLGCVSLAALALCAGTGCKDKEEKKGGDSTGGTGTSADLMTRCDQLGKACGDSDKHVQTIAEECKVAAKDQVVSGCIDKAVSAYDCYLEQLCGKGDKVWGLRDLGVLSERHGKCVAERDAIRTCVETAAEGT